MIVKVKTKIKSMRILNVLESCLKMTWPNMLMSNFLCILLKRGYRRVLWIKTQCQGMSIHPQKMDEFMTELFLEKRNHFEITSDTNLVKLQQRLLDVMGPLSKIWATVESAKNSQDEQVEVSLGDMLRYLDQTAVLLGQAYNNTSYTRRFNVLKQITGDPRKTKKN